MKLNKKQKRTATIASMAALLAVVLGMGGQTFAKYITTTQTETKQATVAKWGFVASINATNMFKSVYTTDTAPVDADDTDGASVNASNVTVAPGTSGSMNIVFSGWAEVDAKVTFDTTGTTWTDIYLSDGAKTYNPVKWTLQDGTNEPEVDGGTLDEVKTALEANSGYYNATKDPTTSVNKNYTLSWVWDYKGVADSKVKNYSTSEANDTLTGDEADTRLGLISESASNATVSDGVNPVPNTYTYSVQINFSLKITVVQVD